MTADNQNFGGSTNNGKGRPEGNNGFANNSNSANTMNFNSGNTSQGDNQAGEIDFKRLILILWRNKWLVVGVTAIFTILAGVYAFTRMPIYQSSGTMMIKQSQNQYSMTGSGIGNLLSSTYGLGIGSTVANELQILRSRSMSYEIAKRLHKERFDHNGDLYPALWRSYPEDSTLISADTAAFRIRSNFEVSQVDQRTHIVRLIYESPSRYEAMRIVNLAMEVYSDLSTDQNRKSASAALDFLDNEKQNLQERLRTAEDSLRKFMNKHQLVEVDAQTRELIQNIAALEGNKQEIKVKLVAVESGIEKYEDELNKIKPGLADQYSGAVGPKLQRYQFQLAELETKKLLMITENPRLKNNPDAPELKRIDEKMDMIRAEINKISEEVISKGDQYASFLGGGNPTGRISELNQKLIELRIERNQYNAQLEVLSERLKQQEEFFEGLPDNMIRLARLEREVNIAEELFMTISKQTAETALWEQTQFGLGREIDSAYFPGAPVKPKKKLFIIVGFLLGGIVSIGWIFLKEQLNTSIDGVEKLRKRGYPLLSVIPDMTKILETNFKGKKMVPSSDGQEVSSTLITLLDSISPTAEAFRRLHNNIIHSHPDEKFKTLMVTSSSKGEGKTTIISNLGVILAEAGTRVLMVDLDLRRPNLHRMFGVSQNNGIIEILFDQITVENAIKRTPVEGVDIITTGQRPPNPAAINQSRGLRELLNKLQQNENYDHILIDTAPYGIITDAAPVMELSDGIILATRFGETEEAQLDNTIENLQRINAHVVGTVLTAFQHEKSSDYYYVSNYNYYAYAYKDYSRYHEEKSE